MADQELPGRWGADSVQLSAVELLFDGGSKEMVIPASIAFPSGTTVETPLDRMKRFLKAEYAWYDGFTDSSPNEILPFDLLVAVGLNAFVGGASVGVLRQIWEGMSADCAPGLSRHSPTRTLAAVSDLQLDSVVDLIYSGCVPRALAAVATKVLHRKRSELIPILDSVVVAACCRGMTVGVRQVSISKVLQDRFPESLYREALRVALASVRQDLLSTEPELHEIASALRDEGWPLTPLRVHDILVWTENEPRSYYR